MGRHYILPLLLMFLLTVWVAAYPVTGFAAEKKEVVAEGTYCMGDGETPLLAEERALLVAKRSAIEQVGTYIESYSAIKNNQLTDDEVKIISSGSMEVTVLEKRRIINENNFNFWVKIKAVVTPDNVETMIAKLKAKKENAGNDIKNDSHTPKGEAISDASVLFQQGNEQMDAGQYMSATRSYTDAIKLSPHFAQAYLKRGEANIKLENYDNAINDLTQALKEDSDLVVAYFWEGQAFEKMKKKHSAIEVYRKFIKRATPDMKTYIDKAKHRLFLLEVHEIIDRDTQPYYYPEPPERRSHDERRGPW